MRKVQVLDRNQVPLTVTYRNRWNVHDWVPLHEIPAFLRQAFVQSEDRRFYRHGGVDWVARLHAVLQNIGAMGAVRGASTITEQVVRMWHPRPRTLWSRWLEGFEAGRFEKMFSKSEILEFYLNQVPYAGLRRGIVQAARGFFDRDPDTLSPAEMLAMVVMVRAPTRLDVRKRPEMLFHSIQRLAARLLESGIITADLRAALRSPEIRTHEATLPVRADHFLQYLVARRLLPGPGKRVRLRTTLDAGLQHRVQAILDSRLQDLKDRGAANGAVLVVDHLRGEILAWANGGTGRDDVAAGRIDAVTTPRQPGSALKPLLYALALEKGWTAATLVDDSPLSEPVGHGLHAYHNYSHTHYGPLRVREALGNSLNIPAVRAIQYVGVDKFLDCLHQLGIHSLQQHPDHYGDGLALGNGEITLLELVQAYTVLARQGIYRPLTCLMDETVAREEIRGVFSAETASLIGNILSDPEARRLEFGNGSLLRFPVQTAVKTGTSSDYRDAWAIAFDYRFTVGGWIGNLDGRAMDGITGAAGPALILRSVLADLNRYQDTRSLYLSPRLVNIEICRDTGLKADGRCASFGEWFVPGSVPEAAAAVAATSLPIYLRQPAAGMQLAMDPRIPDDKEAFVFKLAHTSGQTPVDWYVDGRLAGSTSTGEYLWPLRRGRHSVRARLWPAESERSRDTSEIEFVVK